MKRRGRRFPIRGAIAGAIVVLGAGIAMWLLWPDDKSPLSTSTSTSTSRIKEAKPAVAKRGEAPRSREGTKDLPKPGEPAVPAAAKSVPEPKDEVPYTGSNSLPDRMFRTEGNRTIAHLLMVEPGECILGDSKECYANFNEEFEASLKESLDDLPEDTEEERALKQAMREVREDLLGRMRQGEDLKEIMIAEREKLKELAQYKDELGSQVDAILKEKEMTKKDYNDLIGAVNLMLKDHGIEPVELPSAAKYVVEHTEGGK